MDTRPAVPEEPFLHHRGNVSWVNSVFMVTFRPRESLPKHTVLDTLVQVLIIPYSVWVGVEFVMVVLFMIV